MKRELRIVVVLCSGLVSPTAFASPPSDPASDLASDSADDPAAGRPQLSRGPLGYAAGAPLQWDPNWHRFNWLNGVVLGASLGAGGLGLLIGPDQSATRNAYLAIDETIRDSLRLESVGARRATRLASDVLVGTTIGQAFLMDAVLNAGWYRNSSDVAWQIALINAQVLALDAAIQVWTANLVARQRPYGRNCGTDEETADGSPCTGNYRFQSFYSGHTSTAFAMATAMCTHHAHVPLYRGQGHWVPCATGYVLATATGVARILGDHHYASDAFVGAAVGSVIGGLVPWLHYTAGTAPDTSAGGAKLHITIMPSPTGISAAGVF